MVAVARAASARIDAATASARRFGLPRRSSSFAMITTSAASAAISPGTSIVF
jgi:hypothetical protein